MRKTVLVLLSFLLVVSACGGDGDTAPEEAPAGEETTTEPSDVDPATTVEDPAVPLLVVLRPVYVPGDDDGAYLHELAFWVLEADEPGTTTAQQQASECYASAFVSVLDPARHAGVAGALSGQGLANGLPLDIVTGTERERLYLVATPCLDAAIAASTPEDDADDFAHLDDAQLASFHAGLVTCYETLFADETSRMWLLEDLLFDSPVADQQLGVATLNECSDTLVAPMLTEHYVSEGSDRPATECIASMVVTLMVDNPDIVSDSEDAGEAYELPAAMMSELVTAMSDCETFLPLLTERFVSEGHDPATAECLASKVAALMVDDPDLVAAFAAPDTAGQDPELATAALTVDMFMFMLECDASGDLFAQ